MRYNPCATNVKLAAVPLPDGDIAITAVRTKKKSGGASVPASRVTVITLTINADRELVELRFPGKPDDTVRAEMKAAKFRWYGPAGCWYHKHTPENLAWAQAVVSRQAGPAPTIPPAAPAAVPPVAVTQSQFAGTVPEFQQTINRIAIVAGKPALEVYALWRKYAHDCESGDQSPLLGEFIEWHKPSLGGDMAALRAALEVPAARPPAKPASVGKVPTCVFCGRNGNGVQFAIFNPRFQPFGTACTDCEATLPPDTQLPTKEISGLKPINLPVAPVAAVAMPQASWRQRLARA